MRQQIATCTFQLEVYKKLSQKLRQEVVVARDELAMARMNHLSELATLRKEATNRELLLEQSLASSGMGVSSSFQVPLFCQL